ncbi:MAG: DsbA family protein [Candidatus Hydrogenedentota bacterium]
MAESARKLFYIADPMCSWCYGFAGVIQGIHAQYQDRIDIRLVTGGLRVGSAHRLTDKFRATLSEHWKEVEKETGQAFNYDFAVPEGFVYDTEPSCRAAVVMRRNKGNEVFPFFETLHKAFYMGNRDLTDAEILCELAEAHDLKAETFMTEFNDDVVKQETYDDFAFGHGLGLQGFPSIVLQDARGLALLTSGYQHFEALSPIVDDWLAAGDAVLP